MIRLSSKLFFVPFKILIFIMGIKIEFATNARVLESIGRFRKKIFLEKNYITNNSVPDIWLDRYDDTAVNIVAIKSGKIVGAVRMILKSNDIKLPVEKLFNLETEVNTGVAEISKLAVDKNFRGGNRLVFLGMLFKIFSYSKKNNIKNWVAFMPVGLSDSIKSLGINITELKYGNPDETHRQERKIMSGYFSKQKIGVYFFDLASLYN